jgi:hypothetical protein
MRTHHALVLASGRVGTHETDLAVQVEGRGSQLDGLGGGIATEIAAGPTGRHETSGHQRSR